jgi:hypothetical protein
MTRRSIFQQRFNKRLRFRLIWFGLERELVANVVVVDQVHVTKLVCNSTNLVVNHVASRASIHKSALIFTIVYNKLKNDLRLPLTSQIKELGAILQKLIKFWTWIKSWSKNETKGDGVDGDADVLELLDEERGDGLGATTETETNLFS